MPSPAEVRSLFGQALEKPPADRPAFLEQACAGNTALRDEVQHLLDALDRAGTFLQSQPGTVSFGPAAPASPIDSGPAEGPGLVLAGRYQLVQPIGEGGMGSVWLAQQIAPVQRRVAVKLIKAGMDSRAVLARFEAERQALALMDHPGIAKVLDGGTTARGTPFFVMELVEGAPITAFCDEHRLPVNRRLELFARVCQAVQHAHQKAIIHRDLKPSNVLVTVVDGQPGPKVIDFGLAKALQAGAIPGATVDTAAGSVLGTPLYMAPEQADPGAADVDTRADVYALGALLYELLAGSPPLARAAVRAVALAEVLRLVREADPPTPARRLATDEALPSIAAVRQTDPARLRKEVRGDLEWVTMKCLEKDRDRRYESANALAADVARYLADEPVSAGPPSRWYKARKFVRRNRGAVVAATVVAIALIGGVIGLTWGLVEANHARREAERDRAIAIEEAATSRAVIDFLTDDVLGQSSPDRQPDRDLQVRAALDRAAADLTDQFASRPRVEAALRYSIGAAYRALGEYRPAEEHLVRCVELRRRELGDDAADTLDARNQLGMVFLSRRDFARAEAELAEVRDRAGRALGEEHVTTLSAANNLALAYWHQGRLSDAERLYTEVLDILRRTRGPDDGRTVTALGNLGVLYRSANRPADAERVHREVLAARRQALGEDHLSTCTAKSNLAAVLGIGEKGPEALALLREAAAGYRRWLGDDHPRTLPVLLNLAKVLTWHGPATETADVFLIVLKGEQKYRTGNPEILTSARFAGDYITGHRHPAEAERLLREAVKTADLTGPTWQAAELRCVLGEAMAAQKKYAEAEPLLLNGYVGLERERARVPDANEKLRSASFQLGQLYEATGNSAARAKWDAEYRRWK